MLIKFKGHTEGLRSHFHQLEISSYHRCPMSCEPCLHGESWIPKDFKGKMDLSEVPHIMDVCCFLGNLYSLVFLYLN